MLTMRAITRQETEEAVREEFHVLAERLRGRIASRRGERHTDEGGADRSIWMRALGFIRSHTRRMEDAHHDLRLIMRACGDSAERIVRLCFHFSHGEPARVAVPNVRGAKPEEFVTDLAVGKMALEIKFSDGSTDGDHVAKEKAKPASFASAGFIPVLVMLYPPETDAALKIQQKLQQEYLAQGGQYYMGQDAFRFIQRMTGIDLSALVNRVAEDTPVTALY